MHKLHEHGWKSAPVKSAVGMISPTISTTETETSTATIGLGMSLSKKIGNASFAIAFISSSVTYTAESIAARVSISVPSASGVVRFASSCLR